MKLATLKDGSRDGLLAVVSRDLSTAHFAAGIATTLQQLLDDWNFRCPPLEDLYATLNAGKARHAFAFDPRHCMAPLPRAFQCVEGQGYATFRERVHGLSNPQAADMAPLLHRSGDRFSGPCDDLVLPEAAHEVDCAGQLAVITGDVAAGCEATAALESVRLLVLLNAWWVPATAGSGSAGNPRAQALMPAFGPVAVTPEELGAAWQVGRVRLPLQVRRNAKALGAWDAGEGMDRGFGQIIAQRARWGALAAGSIVCSGPVSHPDSTQGAMCIAERRALESAAGGAPQSLYLRQGERVQVEMVDGAGQSVFGAIDQRLVSSTGAEALAAPAEPPSAENAEFDAL
jgi:fumarylacetoacetate (FAA) hydrolase